MRILIIEDEPRLARVIEKGFEEDGFAVDVAYDGEEGLFLAESESYDALILDLMLPKVDGLTICKTLRAKQIRIPILMLTAKVTLEDRVTGLDSGADDYLTKPFSFLELRSRVHALIRRTNESISPVLKVADLELDPLKHSVRRAGKPVPVTAKEFAVLHFLMQHKDEVVTRTMIMDHAWDYNFDAMSNVIDVFIATLRQKIDRGHDLKLIHTLRGVGYKLSAEAL